MREEITWRTRLVRFLRRDNLPVRARDEEALFEEVKGEPERPLSRESLASLARARGADYAAAWFHTKVLRDRPEPCAPLHKIERILIVPGAFYRTLPEYNTDGQLGIEAARRFGLPVEFAELPEFAPVEECAEALRKRLLGLPDRGTLVVSISKGTADLFCSLHRHPEIRTRISGWISIGGIPRGTYAIDEVLSRGLLGRLFLRLTARLHGGSFATLMSLRAAPGSLLGELPERLPLEFPITCIVPVPLHSHMTNFLRTRFVSLQKQGPNDGMCLLADSVIPGSRAIPVWGADHFFQVPGFSRYLFEALREYVGQRAGLSPLLSASRGDGPSALPPRLSPA